MEPKFNLNREPITDEEINSKKDFDNLIKKFKNESIQKARNDSSFLKNKKATYSTVIAGIAVVCTVTYFSVFKKNLPKENTNDQITTHQANNSNTPKPNKAFIVPPISKINIPYSSYILKAEKGGNFTHKSQSKISIPQKAFVNKQGQDIVGDVEIRYREFHNQADIIASGIPMIYDSAGITSHLESAGMFDIKGYQNGEPVFINPKKTITIELSSQQSADRFNQYILDTIARNWHYIKRDHPQPNQATEKSAQTKDIAQNVSTPDSPTIKSLQTKLDAIPPKLATEKTVYAKKVSQLPKAAEPLKPNKSVTGRPQFELDVNYKEFPELEAFKNAVFEVGTENKNYNSKLADITWSSAQISEGPTKGKNYLLTLKLREHVEKLIVYPALTGTDYDNAIKTYEAKFNEYKGLIAKREAEEQKLKEEFEAKQAAYLAEQKKLNEELVKERIRIRQEQEQQLAEGFKTMGNQQRVTRIFQVSNFGIYNSDCANSMPKGASINPIYVINKGTFITPSTIYLVCHNKNLVYNLAYGTLPYNPNDSYSLCLLANGKMYICSKETFANAITHVEHKIPLTELNPAIDNAFDLKKALGI